MKDWEDIIKKVKPLKKALKEDSYNFDIKDIQNFSQKNDYNNREKDFIDFIKENIKEDYPIPNIMSSKDLKRIKSKKIKLDASLDLHFLTQKEAEVSVINFIEESISKGYKLVLIITGKGNLKEGKYESIIRNMFLNMIKNSSVRKYIISYAEAHNFNGGAGAFYLYLRKNIN